MKTLKLLFAILVITSVSCDKENESLPECKDIDGYVYKTVKIGTQVWMAENLRVTKFKNGTAIPNEIIVDSWTGKQTPVYFNYAESVSNSDTYGKIYNWYAVKDSKGLAPEGWHIPTKQEWETLINYVGGLNTAGVRLKDDAFKALFGGGVWAGYTGIGQEGMFWTSTEEENVPVWININKDSEIVNVNNYQPHPLQYLGYYIRCIKD